MALFWGKKSNLKTKLTDEHWVITRRHQYKNGVFHDTSCQTLKKCCLKQLKVVVEWDKDYPVYVTIHAISVVLI